MIPTTKAYQNNSFGILRAVVGVAKCKPGWSFELTTKAPLELLIFVKGPDSRGEYDGERKIRHHFPVPYATYNYKTWRRWIFECCRKVEDHELGEWFQDGDERPFAPTHGPGEDPYTIHEFRDVVDAYTNQDGTVRTT
jgi:hypothetical protein